MQEDQQAAIVEQICDDLKKELLSKLPHVPENWDGRQLRNWVHLKAKEMYEFDLGKAGNKELKNDIIVRNL